MRPRPINPSTAAMLSTTINSGNVVPCRKAPFRWRPTHHTISELASHHPWNADAIGLSILSGAHMHICPRVMELLKEKGLDDVMVVIGGIIPDVDIPKLRDIGIKGIFLPGTPMQHIITYIIDNVRPRMEQV